MSFTFPSTARGEIEERVATAWLANAPSVTGSTAPPLIWDTTTHQRVPTTAYATVTVRHISGESRSLTGAIGSRKFENSGIVEVIVYVPIRLDSGARDQAEALAKVASDALRSSTPNGVWFRDTVSRELGSDDTFFAVSTTATFVYDMIV